MNKLFAALIVSGLVLSPCLPALADADKPVEKTSVKTKSSGSSDDLNFGDVVNGLSFTGARLVKCSMGLAVGTPIAVLRKTLRTTHDTTKAVTGDNQNEAASVVTEALMLPVGIFVGGIDGLGWSVSNSWKNSEHKKPFDFKKEMFSLGALDD